MIKRLTNGLKLLLIFVLSSCSSGPVEINYGSDNCNFCRMTVTNPKFGAEIVNKNGKAFKYDAIECMVLDEKNIENIKLKLVNDYLDAGDFKGADSCTYLISNALPSPMGAYLSAYANLEKAKEMQSRHGGDIYSYNELYALLESK